MAIIKRKIENLKPGKEYIVTARAKNADVNVVSNYTDTIRFVVPVDTTIPQEVFNLKLYQSIENVMFVFDNVSDKDISTYEYELYSDISGTQLVSTGYNDASVFTVAVSNLQTDAQGEGLVPYWGRVRAIDTSGNMGAWTPLSKTDERVPLIDNQFIGSLTASKITAGSIGAHEIVLTQPGVQTTISTPPGNAVLRSSNYDGSYNAATQTWSEATSGWIITGDGRAEFNNAVIRGNFKSISLDVGTDPNSFHINNLGQVWAGSATFDTAKFSVAPNGTVKISQGSIDIGSGAASFHVGSDGSLWMGSDTKQTAKLVIEPYGEVRMNAGLQVGNANGGWGWPSQFLGFVSMESNFASRGTFSTNEIWGDLSVGLTSNPIYRGRGLMSLSTGNFFNDRIPTTDYDTQTIVRPYGHTQLRITRLTEVPYLVRDFMGIISDRPSHWNKQILQILNDVGVNGNIGGGNVAGIAFGVGKPFNDQIAVAGCSIRCFPATGGSQVPPNGLGWISRLIDDPSNSTGWNVMADPTGNTGSIDGSWSASGMNGAGANGLDISNYKGDGYGFIGAVSFVIRSSRTFKENIEYMPVESRSISVQRIRNLKPARWDDKAKIAYGAPSQKFQDINARWIAKGKAPLKADLKHYETFDHDCTKDDCIGSEYRDCPEVEFQKKRYGFIAEDVAEVFPKAVQFSTLGQPIGIDYAVITYSLVETTQHLLDKIDQLEAKISELTAENNN